MDHDSSSSFEHVPVLRDEVVEAFAAVPAGWIVDGTAGGGGHAAALLAHRDDVSVLAVDRDPAARAAAGERLAPFGERAVVVTGTAAELDALAGESRRPVVGVLLDLGVSSPQIDRADRGFAYGADGPLDMRMDPTSGVTAAELIDRLDEAELSRLLRDLGDEARARRIARAVVAARPLTTTGELAALVRATLGHDPRRGDPAKRTFQALRIAVNDELGQLERALTAAGRIVVPGGRVGVIAYHSGEDRLVKRWMRAQAEPDRNRPRGLPVAPTDPSYRIVSRRPVRASPEELERNPRAASARLRVAERLSGGTVIEEIT